MSVGEPVTTKVAPGAGEGRLEAPYLASESGDKDRTIGLDARVFGSPVNRRLLEIMLTAYASARHLGTHSTKTRGEVRGGGRKPWKQKGTGRARHASIRSPLWRGGAVVFGPRPRSYAQRMPKALRAAALVSALSLKQREKKIRVIDRISLDSPKTRAFAQVLETLGLAGERRMLIVVQTFDVTLRRATSNLRDQCRIEKAADVTADDILRRQLLVIEKDALTELKERSHVSKEDPAPIDTTPDLGRASK